MHDADDKEIEEYFLEHYDALCRYCAARMSNYMFYAEDIVNGTFALLCEKWHGLSKDNIRAWLYRAADNLLKDFYRKQAREAKEIERIEDMGEFTSDDLIYEQDFENISDDEIEIRKYEILNGLSEKDRRLYDMNFVERLSHREICKELSIPEETLKKRVYRLKQKIIHIVGHL